MEAKEINNSSQVENTATDIITWEGVKAFDKSIILSRSSDFLELALHPTTIHL